MLMFDTKKTIKIGYQESFRVNFAVKELQHTLASFGIEAIITADLDQADLKIVYTKEMAKALGIDIPEEVLEEGFQIVQRGTCYYILSNGETGAAYGVYEVSEHLLNHDGAYKIYPEIHNPKCAFRALKFNLPWSSYREGESLEIHKETLLDITFWETFLNMMMKNRFNALTIWALHPFPYMVRTKSFPLACPFTEEELQEWSTLWKSIFKMAKDRGIETYMINWNIFVSEAFKNHYDNQAVSDLDGHFAPYTYHSEAVNQYLRESVTQMIDEYEDLTGFGISLGERMCGMPAEEKQPWVEDVYFRAIREAKREIKFIHRAAFSVSADITRKSIENSDLPTPVYVELKFNWSHAYSTKELLVTHGGKNGISGYWEPKPTNYKMVWMARNEDFFTLRWAQTDFVREHIKYNMHDYVAGYFVGSECYIPAYDYSHSREKYSEHMTWDYAFQKNWLYYMLWGRLLFDPDEKDTIFIKEFERLYSQDVAKHLFEAYAHACKMPMALATFHDVGSDFTLYSEGFISTLYQQGYGDGKAFISLEDICERQPMHPDWLSVQEYVEAMLQGTYIPDHKTTPIKLAYELMEDAIIAESHLAGIKIDQPTLECEVLDVKAWIYLSKYFSVKLNAAVQFLLYKGTGDINYKKSALEYLEQGLEYWKCLVACTDIHYVPQPLIQLEETTKFSWGLETRQVELDLEYVQNTEI